MRRAYLRIIRLPGMVTPEYKSGTDLQKRRLSFHILNDFAQWGRSGIAGLSPGDMSKE